MHRANLLLLNGRRPRTIQLVHAGCGSTELCLRSDTRRRLAPRHYSYNQFRDVDENIRAAALDHCVQRI